METTYWHKKWENNEIAFHQSEANPFLVEHLDKLSLSSDARVFVPLCGKTLDIHWLLSRGYRVAGAELSPNAVEQLFAELGVEPARSAVGALTHYSAPDIDIFVGNIFDLSADVLGTVDAVYDRAALVALPEGVRDRYAAHITEITGRAPQLLICYEYDQNSMPGPPFSITNREGSRHYQDAYRLTLISSAGVAGGLKGNFAVKENVWLLSNRNDLTVKP